MSDNKLSTFFCRIGSKKPIVKDILKLIPDHKVYIEPFIGSGAVFFSLPDYNTKKIINDLDKRLIDGYKILKKGVNIPENYLENKSLDELNNIHKKETTEKDKLLSVLLDCNTFSSKSGINNKIYKTSTHKSKLNNLDEYKDVLKNVTILNQDYKKVIDKYDSPSSFFYLDPPYENSENLYKHGSFNFVELADKLKNIKGMFLLSINDSKDIRELFKGFNIKQIKVRGGAGENKVGLGTGVRNELLISNYVF
jgi:DNA adenine methylase